MSEQRDQLPADEGRAAYEHRQTPDANPYSEDDWRRNEWWLGWSMAEESDGDSWDWATDSFKPKCRAAASITTTHNFRTNE